MQAALEKTSGAPIDAGGHVIRPGDEVWIPVRVSEALDGTLHVKSNAVRAVFIGDATGSELAIDAAQTFLFPGRDAGAL